MANQSASSPGTDASAPTALSVVLHARSTSLDAQLTFSPAVGRWLRRCVMALLVWAMTAMVGSSIWTFVMGLR